MEGLPVRTSEGQTLGTVVQLIFDPTEVRLWGIEVDLKGMLTGRRLLSWEDIIALGQEGVVIDKASQLKKDLSALKVKRREGGTVIGLPAATQNQSGLGRVRDLMIESETGAIVRFLLVRFFQERLIPRQFLVTINSRQVVFQDTVEKPTFDKLASQATSAKTAS